MSQFLRRDFIKNDYNFWRYLINFWSLLFFSVIILDFFAENAYSDILNVLSMVYISVLAIYVSNKEFERWYDKHESKHPGEIFVVIWSLIVFTLFLLDYFYNPDYQIPNSIISSYIAVLTILAVTKKSKEMYQRRRSLRKRGTFQKVKKKV